MNTMHGLKYDAINNSGFYIQYIFKYVLVVYVMAEVSEADCFDL